MPRYFFHVHDGRDIPDEEGVKLAGPEEAQDQAVVADGESLRDDSDGKFRNAGEWRMVVVDEAGSTICPSRSQGTR